MAPPATSPRATGRGAPDSHVPPRRTDQVAKVGVALPGFPVATTMASPVAAATGDLRASGRGGRPTQRSAWGS